MFGVMGFWCLIGLMIVLVVFAVYSCGWCLLFNLCCMIWFVWRFGLVARHSDYVLGLTVVIAYFDWLFIVWVVVVWSSLLVCWFACGVGGFVNALLFTGFNLVCWCCCLLLIAVCGVLGCEDWCYSCHLRVGLGALCWVWFVLTLFRE